MLQKYQVFTCQFTKFHSNPSYELIIIIIIMVVSKINLMIIEINIGAIIEINIIYPIFPRNRKNNLQIN